MMKNAIKGLCIVLIAVCVCCCVPAVTVSYAERQMPTNIAASDEVAQNSLRICSDEKQIEAYGNIVRAKPVNAVIDDVPHDYMDAGYSTYETWVDVYSRVKGLVPGALRSVTLAVSSSTSRTITLSASAISSGRVSKIGVERINLQRYYHGRWLTVYTLSNRTSSNASRFSISQTRYRLISRDYYRVNATFIAVSNGVRTTVTRTTGSIRCR